MKIIYVSSLCSQKVLNLLLESSSIKPGQAPQKFNRLLANGLASHENDCIVETLSEIPVPSRGHERRFWSLPSEKEGKVRYHYIPMATLPVLKSILVLVNSFVKLSFLILSRRTKTVILCDVINVPLSFTVFLIRILLGVKTVAIVTDLPSIDFAEKQKVYKKLSNLIIDKFDAYVLLTAQMNNVVNPNGKPFLIMEGLVDLSMSYSQKIINDNPSERIILYAGGLSKVNGLDKLIEAFLQLKENDVRFHIYGSGEMERDMQHYMNLDNRLIYHGVLPNSKIVEQELQATLLVNPRPTKQNLAKYSFPSKNMEYMVSGTPVVTTCLPGMPIEYHDYVYLFKDETVDGLLNTLRSILSLNKNLLDRKGKEAKKFVLENKNNIIQARRVLDLCKILV